MLVGQPTGSKTPGKCGSYINRPPGRPTVRCNNFPPVRTAETVGVRVHESKTVGRPYHPGLRRRSSWSWTERKYRRIVISESGVCQKRSHAVNSVRQASVSRFFWRWIFRYNSLPSIFWWESSETASETGNHLARTISCLNGILIIISSDEMHVHSCVR